MRRFLLPLLLLAPACAAEGRGAPAPAVTSAVTSGAHAETIRALAQPFIDGQWANGLAIGVIANGQVETYGFGAAKGGGAAPDENTLFEIGSVSKVFTSLLLAEAVKRGEVTLDQEVGALVPAGTTVPEKNGTKMTLRHLATHASGLPRLPASILEDPNVNPGDPYATYARENLYADLPVQTLATEPGKQYAYSNFGAALLGQVLADRAGAPYAELITARIAGPLAMTHTTAEFSTANAAEPHDADGDAVPYWHQLAMAPAGAVRSNLHDMMLFAQAELDAPADSAMALTQATQATPFDPDLDGNRAMGLGWHTNLGPGFEATLWHNGETGGFHSFVAVDRGTKTSVVLLANTAEIGLDRLGALVLRALGGAPVSAGVPPLVDVPAKKVQSYVGRYALSPTFILDVTAENGRLFVTPTNQPKFRLFPTSETTFVLHAVEASVEFKDGNAILHQNGDHLATKLPQ